MPSHLIVFVVYILACFVLGASLYIKKIKRWIWENLWISILIFLVTTALVGLINNLFGVPNIVGSDGSIMGNIIDCLIAGFLVTYLGIMLGFFPHSLWVLYCRLMDKWDQAAREWRDSLPPPTDKT